MNMSPKVIIQCLVYNHESYLRDCLNGFVMQKTDFPFIAVVHDDCSTDSSAAIIQEYAEKYPHIIEPIYEDENLYSKRDGSFSKVIKKSIEGRSPYIALCEGDDYWTDPYKLQKQVEYMDSHPDCSMCCSNAEVFSDSHILTDEELKNIYWPLIPDSGNLNPQEIILQGGWYLHTCTLLYRADLKKDMPEAAMQCMVGDYPLQIFAALKGDVYYFSEKMAVYRFLLPNSWTKKDADASNAPIKLTLSLLNCLSSLDEYSNKKLHDTFVTRQINLVTKLLESFPNERKEILKSLGWVLKYDYVASILKHRRIPLFKRFKFRLTRFFTWPYHPIMKKIIRGKNSPKS